MKIPHDMVAELAAWNSDRGISLDTWVACAGNMKLAVGYSTIFWPKFKLLSDYIVKEEVTEESLHSFEAQGKKDRKGIEAVLNHLHIADIQSAGCVETTVDRIKFLLPILKEIYEAKLAWQFPDRPCTVYTYEPEKASDLIGYQFTFWQKKHEEA